MNETPVLRWFGESAYGELVRDVYWLFSALEIVHFVALCVLFGALLFIDLRVLGFSSSTPLRVVLRFIPVATIAFVAAAISGLGFFSSAPLDYWPNPSFRLKLVLIILAGLNAAWFAVSHRRSQIGGDTTEFVSLPMRISAGASLVLWSVIIVLGRLLPYTGTSQ